VGQQRGHHDPLKPTQYHSIEFHLYEAQWHEGEGWGRLTDDVLKIPSGSSFFVSGFLYDDQGIK
jgi:hypothetical protein